MGGLSHSADSRDQKARPRGVWTMTRRTFAGVAAGFGFGFSCKNNPSGPTDPDAARLVFGDATESETAGMLTFPPARAVQSRIAKVRTDRLLGARVGDQLVFNLFPNRRYEVRLASRNNSIDPGYESDIIWLADVVGANRFAGVSLNIRPEGVISGFVTISPISGLSAAYFDIGTIGRPNVTFVPNFAYIGERPIG